MTYDVAVIGAGPSGSFAALDLSSRGIRTLLIDPQNNKKVCAGILTAQYIKKYGINDYFSERELKGARISFRDIKAEIDYGKEDEFSIDRQAYDSYNINKAVSSGVTLKKDMVLTLLESDEGVKIRTKKDIFTADYAIVSSGVSDLGRNMGGAQKFAYCVQQKEEIIPGDYFEMNLFKGGYSWKSPKKDHILTGTSSTTGYPDHPGEKAMIPIGGPVENTYSGKYLLAGDAAGFVSPFEGEGLYYARRSGEIAAEVLSGVISGKNPISDYEKNWKKEFDFSGLDLLSGLLSNDRVLELFVREIRDNDRFNKLVGSILTRESKKLNKKEITCLLKKLV